MQQNKLFLDFCEIVTVADGQDEPHELWSAKNFTLSYIIVVKKVYRLGVAFGFRS